MNEHEFPPGRPAWLKPKGRPTLGQERLSQAFSEHLHRLAYKQGMSIKQIASRHDMAYGPIHRRVTKVERERREARRR